MGGQSLFKLLGHPLAIGVSSSLNPLSKYNEVMYKFHKSTDMTRDLTLVHV